MTDFEGSARRLSRELDGLGLAHALVGGLAISVWCEPRFTRDIDFVVTVSNDTAAESAVRALTASGYQLLAVVEQEAASRLAAARLAVSSSGDVVDLLFASSGIEHEITQQAQPVEVLPGLTLPVAGVGHLIALKILSVDDKRPQDRVDLRALTDIAGAGDIEMARNAVDLITARGYHRGRDLAAALASVLASRGDGGRQP